MRGREFCYAGTVKIPVSIALFFLLSGLFLFSLLAALQRSKKAGAVAAVCLVAVVLLIVLVRPVQLWPSDGSEAASTTTEKTLGVASSDSTDGSADGSSTTITSVTSSTISSSPTTTIVVSTPTWEETFSLEAMW